MHGLGKKNTLMVTEFGLHYNAVVFQGINFMDTNIKHMWISIQR